MTRERFVELCNRLEFPLREFVERTVGPARHHRAPIDLGMRWPPYTAAELELMGGDPDLVGHEPRWVTPLFDVSRVHTPADRVGFKSLETVGDPVGHTSGLERIEFG